MNRFFLPILSLLLGAVTWTSCTTGTVDPDDGDWGLENFMVSFEAQLGAMSRATDVAFDVDDPIGVFAVTAQDGDSKGYISSGGNYADNVKYIYNGTKFTSTTGIIPTEGEKYFYHAVYPYTSTASSFFRFVVQTDQRGENYTKSDLCTAHSIATSSRSVQLNFGHRLAKLIINLEGGNWPAGDCTLTLSSPIISAFVDLNDMEFDAAASTDQVICAENGLKSFKAILPPQTISKSDFAVLNIGGQDYPVNLTNDVQLQSGVQKELTLSFDESSNSVVEFKGTIDPWEEDEDPRMDDVVPEEIQEKLDEYIPVYKGVNPPNVEGSFYMDPNVAVYCEDNGFQPGEAVLSEYIRFSNQDMTKNTLDYEQKRSNSYMSGTGAFISGSGSNFTAFFNIEGYTDDIYNKTALVISGTKTETGIKNLYYAFIMVEKGEDPENLLMQEGYFRVFKDEDGLSDAVSWPENLAPARSVVPLRSAVSAKR